MQQAPPIDPHFSILVAGHRPHRLPTDEAALHAIESAIDRLVVHIAAQFAELADCEQLYGPQAPRRCVTRIIGGGYTGTDEMAARIAARRGCPLHRVMTAAEAQQSRLQTEGPDRRDLVLGEANDAGASSVTINLRDETALAFSDLLMVVWDGHDPRGPAGGTVRLLREAVLCSKPVIWIDLAGTARLLDISRIDEPTLFLLGADDSIAELLAPLFATLDEQALDVELALIANPLAPQAAGRVSPALCDRVRRYFTQRAGSRFSERRAGIVSELLKVTLGGSLAPASLLTGIRKVFARDATRPWFGVAAERGADGAAASALPVEPAGIEERFNWSDYQANLAAGIRRDVTLFLYAFATLAVFAAVAGNIKLGVSDHSSFWTWVELGMIMFICVLVMLASRRRWHGEWLSHRLVAEELRCLRLGYPFVAAPESCTQVPRRSDAQASGRARWVLDGAEQWALRRSAVASGLPRLPDGSAFVAHERFSESRQYLLDVLVGQADYHRRNAETHHRMSHRLHHTTGIAFLLTGCAVVAHFFLHADWLLLFTAALPALASGIHGLVSSNEMERVATMSEEAGIRLRHVVRGIERLEQRSDSRWIAWLRLRQLACEGTAAMSEVNGQWQDLLKHRETTLPA
ncbi:MAG: hypothetical protein KA310_09420 [Pseudomonadales bacterium]|jgi:hypothetical protein|nr:hypothetical protein [Gammaproteobacteria bacterium]MBP6481065.1 hypothetical protein [Pseudomonadales bacterium]MBP7908936.1 hypothetical protein [Pseudomonadales bacterium]